MQSPYLGLAQWAPALRSLTAIIHLPCHVSWDSYHRFQFLQKVQLLLTSLLRIWCNFILKFQQSFALSKREGAINNFLLWKVQETAVWILVLIAKSQEVQHEYRICIVNFLVKTENLERLEWN